MVGTPPFVSPPAGNIPSTWVRFGDGHWGPPSGGIGGSDELFYAVDTSTADQVFTLPDPATLPTPFITPVNVLNWNGGVFELHIVGTIDGFADGIRTRTNQQGYRFRWGAEMIPPVSGWACAETKWGGDPGGTAAGGPPEGAPGIVACGSTVPNWIQFPDMAADYQVLTAASGTYTKPVGSYTFVGVVGFGSGGGGGTGNGGDSADNQGGGAGGGGGARKVEIFDYDTFPASVTYAIHQGGAGGAQIDIPPATVGNRTLPGADGGESTLTDSTPTIIFSVGGGLGGPGGVQFAMNDVGGQGGSWDQNGTVLGTNANGTGGDGGGGCAGARDNFFGNPIACAECGGGGGGGLGLGNPTPSGGMGGSSDVGGGGGGSGSGVFIAPISIYRGGDGGGHSGLNGGGAPAGINVSQNGADGAAGTGLQGGEGGGGGMGCTGPLDGTSGRGGDGGIPGGGGGGSGAPLIGGARHVARGGNGARGEIRMYVV